MKETADPFSDTCGQRRGSATHSTWLTINSFIEITCKSLINVKIIDFVVKKRGEFASLLYSFAKKSTNYSEIVLNEMESFPINEAQQY